MYEHRAGERGAEPTHRRRVAHERGDVGAGRRHRRHGLGHHCVQTGHPGEPAAEADRIGIPAIPEYCTRSARVMCAVYSRSALSPCHAPTGVVAGRGVHRRCGSSATIVRSGPIGSVTGSSGGTIITRLVSSAIAGVDTTAASREQ